MTIYDYDLFSFILFVDQTPIPTWHIVAWQFYHNGLSETKCYSFSFTKMRMKMSSAKWRPFCLGLNVLTHYFRWLNAKEANPQCTEAASLVSFALSHPFVICHQLNTTLYCASITSAHAFPFRVASMPAVRYDLSGGLPTCLWLFIYQDYSVICNSKKLM